MNTTIMDWLEQHGVTTCSGLKSNEAFRNFIGELFPNKTEEEIVQKIRQCCIAMSNLEEFSACLATGLSN